MEEEVGSTNRSTLPHDELFRPNVNASIESSSLRITQKKSTDDLLQCLLRSEEKKEIRELNSDLDSERNVITRIRAKRTNDVFNHISYNEVS